MRASSLANDKIISLLNAHFVSVYVSNEDYSEKGPAPAAEKAEKTRIYREALAAKLSTGSVHAYILNPDGHPIDSQHVAVAAKVEEMTKMLERNIEKLHVKAGKPLVEPTCQSCAPKPEPGGLVLHLIARNLERIGNDLVPHAPQLGQNRSIGWGSYAVEDWITFSPQVVAEVVRALPTLPETSVTLDAGFSSKLLTHVYPSTENNDVSKNRFEHQQLRATFLEQTNGRIRIRLDGQLRMEHWFYHKPDGKFVDATLLGYVEFEKATKVLREFKLITQSASYAGRPFGAVVRSVR